MAIMKKPNKSKFRKLYTTKSSQKVVEPVLRQVTALETLDQLHQQRRQLLAEREQALYQSNKEKKAERARERRKAEKERIVAEKLKAFQERCTLDSEVKPAKSIEGLPKMKLWDLSNFDEVAFDQSVYDGLSAAGKAHYLKCCQVASGEIAPPPRKKTVGDIADRVVAKSVYKVECSRCGYENTFPKNPASDQVLTCSNCGLTHTGV